MPSSRRPKRRWALVSVFNKEGIVEFVRALCDRGFDLLASGGTAKALKDGGLEVTDVAEWVGGGAILGHKVVTLSRQVHAGLLAADIEIEEIEKLGLRRIDLVCCDLYPLAAEIAKSEATEESVWAKIVLNLSFTPTRCKYFG